MSDERKELMKKYENKSWLYQKYIVEKLSTIKIAKLVKRNTTTINNHLRKFNISVRTRTELFGPNRMSPFYTHGDSRPQTRLYRAWANMKARCCRKSDVGFHRYGGRGIKVCDNWFNDYSAFKQWALVNGYQEKLSLDRIDNEGNYEPHNCQWITSIENSIKDPPPRDKIGRFTFK